MVGSNNRIRLQKLTIGRDFGSSVEVLGGLAPEDAVVVNPPDALEDGESVVVKSSTPPPARSPNAQDGRQ